MPRCCARRAACVVVIGAISFLQWSAVASGIVASGKRVQVRVEVPSPRRRMELKKVRVKRKKSDERKNEPDISEARASLRCAIQSSVIPGCLGSAFRAKSALSTQ